MSRAPIRTALSQGPCPAFPVLAGRYLGEYLEKIHHAVDRLDDDQLWWRPAAGTNSIANLLLHLAGNLSLWLRGGVGGEEILRDRAGEFAADHSHSRDKLLARLDDAVARCRAMLESFDGALDRRLTVQKYETDVMGAVFHAVEHMAYHTGQILYVAKLLGGAGHGIELYPQHRGE